VAFRFGALVVFALTVNGGVGVIDDTIVIGVLLLETVAARVEVTESTVIREDRYVDGRTEDGSTAMSIPAAI
jgi:hypothetical protein